MSQTTIEVTTPRGTMPRTSTARTATGPLRASSCSWTPPASARRCSGYAERLAGAGYTAILPDLYYPFDPAERPNTERMAAGDPEEFARMQKLVAQIHDDEFSRTRA